MSRINLFVFLASAIACNCVQIHAEDASSAFMIGADISWVQQQEVEGKKWLDDGVEKDIFAILKDHGFNWIRLRIFVNPDAEGGYSKEGFCDLEHTLQMAKRVKAAGMKLLLDFHYSDTWADPGHQHKPKAWANLHGAELEKAIYDHTRDVLTALKERGTSPDMVQIGNEISNGFLWPDGKVWENKDWETFCDLIQAGIDAAKEVNPSIKTMVHLAWGGQNAQSRAFLDKASAQGLDFDILGQSYYPKWHGTLEDLKANLTDLAQRYKQPIIVVEYSVPNIREINDIVRGLPNGKGLGTFIWEPTKWQGPALFDVKGNTKPEIDIYAEMTNAAFAADERQPAAERPTITVSVNSESLIRLPSQWPEYFGTHYSGSPEGVGRWWNTVRSFGGTHTGVYATENSPEHVGPFTGRTVRVGLHDFHSRFNRSGRSAEQLIPDLIEHQFTAIYQMTTIVRPSLEPFDKDLAYWTVYQIHKEFPEASKYVAWQIGNEVVSGHFDPKGVRQQGKPPEVAPDGKFHGYDLDWKENFYVEEYLAPAIEAIERASKDVYGDSQKIKILLGSMNPYNRQNIEFLRNVMERKFTGRRAPTLAGEPVWNHVDVLTVHYMFGGERTVQRMQGYVDDYLRKDKVSGIWMTEDHGRAGKGPVTVIERGFRFMAWVARNKLDANQARLVWWGDGARKPGGSAREAEQLLGDFLCGRTIYFSERSGDDGHVYVISDGLDSETNRILLALVPNKDSDFEFRDVRLGLPEDGSNSAWAAEAIQFSASKPPARTDLPVISEKTGLRISITEPVTEPMLLLLRQPEPEGVLR